MWVAIGICVKQETNEHQCQQTDVIENGQTHTTDLKRPEDRVLLRECFCVSAFASRLSRDGKLMRDVENEEGYRKTLKRVLYTFPASKNPCSAGKSILGPQVMAH